VKTTCPLASLVPLKQVKAVLSKAWAEISEIDDPPPPEHPDAGIHRRKEELRGQLVLGTGAHPVSAPAEKAYRCATIAHPA